MSLSPAISTPQRSPYRRTCFRTPNSTGVITVAPRIRSQLHGGSFVVAGCPCTAMAALPITVESMSDRAVTVSSHSSAGTGRSAYQSPGRMRRTPCRPRGARRRPATRFGVGVYKHVQVLGFAQDDSEVQVLRFTQVDSRTSGTAPPSQ